MTKQVDIIIPVHNRLEHTRQTFESLLKNTNPELYNLSIINDGSDEETSRYLEALFDALPSGTVLLTHKAAIGPGASRNQACQDITDSSKRAKYLYLSDNDVYFTPGWLEKLIKAYEDLQNQEPVGSDWSDEHPWRFVKGPKVKLLGGGCHPYLQNNQAIYVENRPDSPRVGIKDAVSGYSQLMTWETWDTFGPLDEGTRGLDKKIAGSEDWAFCQKIIKAGFLVGSLEPEVIIHTGKTNTYGEPATGSETFKDIEGVEVK